MYEQAAESGHSCPALPLPEGFYYPGDEEEWNAAVACVSYRYLNSVNVSSKGLS